MGISESKSQNAGANQTGEGLYIESLYVDLEKGSAKAVTIDGATLSPPIPFDQLARFLDYHVLGSVNYLVFNGSNQLGSVMLQLLNNVTAERRLHTYMLKLNFADFQSLPWPTIERIFNGQTLRPEAIRFTRLRLPSGVDVNKLLQMPAIRDCTHLEFDDESQPPLAGAPPLFKNVSLMEWIKRSGGRELDLTDNYLYSGFQSLLNDLVKDFRQATQAHSYLVTIKCPNIKAIERVPMHPFLGRSYLGYNERHYNRLGDTLEIKTRENRSATKVMGDGEAFEVVSVLRETADVRR